MQALIIVAGGLFLAYQLVKPPAVATPSYPRSAADMNLSMELLAHPMFMDRVPKDTSQGPEFMEMPQ